MEVLSPGRLRVASIVWQPRPGAFALTVVCKATFILEPGTSPFTGVQDEPHGLLSLKLADGIPLRLADGHCGACAGGVAITMAIAEHARPAPRRDGHRPGRLTPTA